MELDYNFFAIEKDHLVPGKGKALVSEPFLNDTYFKRSIVLLAEHSNEGAVGFVLNKPVSLKMQDLLPEFPKINASISIGGPVNTDTLHYIHTLGDIVPHSVRIIDGIYWGGDFEAIRKLTESGIMNQTNIRFFLGYSGWDGNQLEEELSRHSWVVTNISHSEIMKGSNHNIWKETLNNLGPRYSLWSNFPENPQYN